MTVVARCTNDPSSSAWITIGNGSLIDDDKLLRSQYEHAVPTNVGYVDLDFAQR